MIPSVSPDNFYGKKRKRSQKRNYAAKKARLTKSKSVPYTRTGGRAKRGMLESKTPKLGGMRRYSRRITNGISGLSFSNTYLKSLRKLPKIMKMISQMTTYETYWTNGFTSQFNTQGVFVNATPMLNGDINNLTNLALQKLNYLGTASGSSLQVGQRSFKMYLEDFQLTSQFTNQAPTSVEFDIYDLVAKNTSQNYASPATEWESGIDDQNQSGNPSLSSSDKPFSVPTTSKRFNIAWKIVGKNTVELAAGRTHEHKFTKKVNIPIDTEYPNVYAQIKGITCAQLIIMRGGLGDSNNSRSAGTIGFTAGKLICMNRLRLQGRLVSDNPRNYSQNSYLVTTEPANVYVQDEGSGAVTDTKVVTTYA